MATKRPITRRQKRYCTGYPGDIGMPKPWADGDCDGRFESCLGGRWYAFDAHNNIPRIGRVLIAQGRDAADVPITQNLGPNTPVSFKVWADEIDETTQAPQLIWLVGSVVPFA